MNGRYDGSSVDLERTLARVMIERRISRRQLLEAAARLGPVAALGPILAACAGGAVLEATGSPAPPASAAPPTAAPSTAPEPTPAPTPEAELNVYNWDAYIGE